MTEDHELRHPPGHFYSPSPDRAEVRRRRDKLFDRARTELPGIDLNLTRQEELLLAVRATYDELPFGDAPGAPPDGCRYGYANDQYSYADAICLHGLLRHIAPKRVIEVGSGHSSALMLDVRERFLDGALSLTFVEPYPERLRGLLRAGDHDHVRILEQPVQDVPLALFEELEEGDILFIDSTHVSKTGSDVNHLYLEILPLLRRGVWVHVHDVHYPFEYPEEWVEQGYAWNEAYLLRAFLAFNSAFRIQLFPTFAELFHEEWFRAEMPLCLRNPGGSLWMRREA